MSSYWNNSQARDLGRPVERLTAGPDVTHVVTVPGTNYLAFLGDAYMLPSIYRSGSNAGQARAPKVEQLLAALARTTVSSNGRRRMKAAPVLQTIAEFQTATNRQAA